ncbi:MAG: hypothetical protein Q4F33_00630 [Mycoplasmatota bacterium]|nr:hypothetical protein [Mycoplasmatota bacterium]
MRDQEETIRRLNFENWIWVTFIVVSALDIYGDELIKKSITENDKEAQTKSENLFIFLSLFSILVYIYFLYRNYSDYKKYHNELYKIRLIASGIILLGSILLLYFQLNVNNNDDLPSNI